MLGNVNAFIRYKTVDKKVLFSGEVENYFSASPQIKVFLRNFFTKKLQKNPPTPRKKRLAGQMPRKALLMEKMKA